MHRARARIRQGVPPQGVGAARGERSDEACEVLLGAIEKGLDNNDLVRMGITIKGKAFVPMAAARKPGGPDPPKEVEKPKENVAPAPPKQKLAAAAADPMGAAKKQHLYQLDPESFAGLMIQDVFKEVLEKKQVPTIVYLQPAPPKSPAAEEPGLAAVGIDKAFDSPQTLANCTDFANHIRETGSQSAMVVVRKSKIGYPCVWKGKAKGAVRREEGRHPDAARGARRARNLLHRDQQGRRQPRRGRDPPAGRRGVFYLPAPIPIECNRRRRHSRARRAGHACVFLWWRQAAVRNGRHGILSVSGTSWVSAVSTSSVFVSVVAPRASGRAAWFACQDGLATAASRRSGAVALARSARSAAGFTVCAAPRHGAGRAAGGGAAAAARVTSRGAVVCN